SGIVILDFGKPSNQNGSYGTITFDSNFHSTNDITSAVLGFASGFWDCSSRGAAVQKVTIGIGLNNCYQVPACSGPTDYTNYADGQAWHSMVNTVYQLIQGQPWKQTETVHAAADQEVGRDASTATEASATRRCT